MLSTALVIAVLAAVPDPTSLSIETYRTRIGLGLADSAYSKLDWDLDLGRALAKSVADQKPVLVWVEAGHPLSTTDAHGIDLRQKVWNQASKLTGTDKVHWVAMSTTDWLSAPGNLDRPKPESGREFAGVLLFTPEGKLVARNPNPSMGALQTMIDLGMPKAAGATDWKPFRDYEVASKSVRLKSIARDVTAENQLADSTFNVSTLDVPLALFEPLMPKFQEVGQTAVAGNDLARFFAQYLWVDFSKGIALPFDQNHLQEASLVSRIYSLDPKSIKLEFTGRTTATASGTWTLDGNDPQAESTSQTRGVEAVFSGRVRFDRASKSWTDLEMIALCDRWGGSPFNGRKDKTDPSPIAIYSAQVAGALDLQIPPTFVPGN
ncbi:MAG: hypothetical protein JST40_02845 [Armatimonadetes bacterium]|nr:hypothetical protein [Armatimonadota bacterium]